ncbi:hypothetical protein [Nonomuraea sp. NPDC005692]|uniref:hypothetical protein n=1 Tax=Nonomuraea sp. NPDC005692 TaxID=3157168 RepID=UPI00340B7E87
MIVEVPVSVTVSGWMTCPVPHWVWTVGTAAQAPEGVRHLELEIAPTGVRQFQEPAASLL